MLISDPCVPVKVNTISGDEIMRHKIMFSSEKERLGDRQHALITSVKLKLASATELRKPTDVRKWILVLAKSMANYGMF